MKNTKKQNIQKIESDEKVNLEPIYIPLCKTEEEIVEKFINPFVDSLELNKNNKNNV